MNNTITITEAVFIVSAVLNLLSFILVFLMYTHVVTIKNTVNQLKEGVGTTISRLLGIEHMLSKLGNSFTEFINSTGDMIDKLSMMSMLQPMGKIYKTSDGKFTATSIDDLMDKVKNSKKETEYFSDDELNNLKKLFDVDDDDEDDDDEDDYLDNEENTK